MNDARRLRFSILMALASSGAITSLACGGESTSDGASGAGGKKNTGGANSGGASNTGGASSGGASTGGVGNTGGTLSTGGVGNTGGEGNTGGTGTGGGGGGPPTCDYGTPAQSCYTLTELQYMINNPPQGGDMAEDAGAAPDAAPPLTECPEAPKVLNGCCNPASAGPEKQGDTCCYWFCEGACCGRPFVVDGLARVARATLRNDWLAPDLGDSIDDLDSTTRRALAAAWLRDAQMEHASIASFARFTLELLSVGAPPDLVADSQRASLDEIEHARLCFALASRFSEAPVGPATLDIGGSNRTISLADCAAAAVREGCIGETIAALVAREELTRADDPGVRETLAQIAADEERHSAFAWRFVRWALAQNQLGVREAVEEAFHEGMRSARSAPVESTAHLDTVAWRRFGRLIEAEAIAVTNAALDEVIAPCVDALFASDTLSAHLYHS